MFRFFTEKKWALWAYLGLATVFTIIYLQVQVDVAINGWFGEFYNSIQQALTTPNSVTLDEYLSGLWRFLYLAGIWVSLGLGGAFLTSHVLFRWRTSMAEYYHSVYHKARTIEGASQRVQEDTLKFARIIEDLGSNLVEAVLVLIEFFPLLLTLSVGLPLLYFGDVVGGFGLAAIGWAILGTLSLILAGWLLGLVGIEYDLQAKEAAYRKALVLAEDDGSIRPKTFEELYDDLRGIHYKSYLRYLYFNIVRLAYLQTNVIVGYAFLAPSIVGGMVTLGVMQQILRAFGKVAESLQYIFKSWPKVIELVSVYKRLNEFERRIKEIE